MVIIGVFLIIAVAFNFAENYIKGLKASNRKKLSTRVDSEAGLASAGQGVSYDSHNSSVNIPIAQVHISKSPITLDQSSSDNEQVDTSETAALLAPT